MQRTLVRKLGITCVVLIFVGISVLSIALIARAKNDSPFVLKNQIAPLVSRAQLVGPASSQQQLNLSVGLQLRNQQELDNLLSAIYDPHSSMYHHFLTPQAFAAEFGPTNDQVQQVKDYLQQQGLTVIHVSSNGLLIDTTATVAQAEAAFSVTINDYTLGSHTFFANANPPVIPSSLSSLIASIGGLDNSVHMHPLYQLVSPPPGKPGLNNPRVSHTNASPQAPKATQSGYGPSDLNGAYDGTALQQAGGQGSNQTVAIFELDGYQSSDVTTYFQNYSLGNPSITNVSVDGFNGSAGAGAIEVELDIEVVAAMAPKAAQVVYEGPNTTQGVNDTYNQIVTDNKAQVMTTSWGECESQSGNAELQTLDNIFKQGASQGISMYAAAGDSGAYDCGDTNLAVDSPAGDPYITGVGGTNLQISNGAYGSESVWSNPADTQQSPEGAGGGGGISSFFPQPSWQTGPGVKNQYSNGNREVPDVSADADPQTGYAVYCTVSAAGCSSSGGWIVVGGTSAAAPLWAGSTANINDYLQKQQKSRVGFANPVLYGLENAQQPKTPFHDVTSGNNLYYPATPGYDEASGWGSPDIYNIAQDIAGGVNPPPPSPTPSPTSTPSPSPTATQTSTPTPSPTVTQTSTPSPSPTVTNTPEPTSTPPGPSNSLIQDGGFEDGSGVWQESSAGGYELIDTTNPHTGQYSAYLCGYSNCDDVISQDFTVPTNASNISLSYWWYGDTNSTSHSCKDALTVSLLDSNGSVIGKVQQSCNTDANQSWQQVQANITSLLSNYAGQTVTLVFEGKTSYSHATTAFFVDDVAVTAS